MIVRSRYDNRSADVSDLRADFRRQLVNPLPRLGQNISERDYQERHIPGGKESLSRETEGKSGTSRHGAHGVTQFAESKQSLSYKKGTEEVLAKLIKDHTWESIYRS